MKYEIINETLMIDQDADLDKIKQETTDFKSTFNKYYSKIISSTIKYVPVFIAGEIPQFYYGEINDNDKNKEIYDHFDKYYDNLLLQFGGRDVVYSNIYGREIFKTSGLTSFLKQYEHDFFNNLQILHENDYKSIIYDKYGASSRLKNKLNECQYYIAEWLREYFKLGLTWRFYSVVDNSLIREELTNYKLEDFQTYRDYFNIIKKIQNKISNTFNMSVNDVVNDIISSSPGDYEDHLKETDAFIRLFTANYNKYFTNNYSDGNDLISIK